MENKTAKQIAHSLGLLLGIPDGGALVQAIGNGDEVTNIEAVTSWVLAQEDLFDMKNAGLRLERYVYRLRGKLIDLQMIAVCD